MEGERVSSVRFPQDPSVSTAPLGSAFEPRSPWGVVSWEWVGGHQAQPWASPRPLAFQGQVYLRGWAQTSQLFLLLTGSSVDQPRGSLGGSFWHSRPTRGTTQLVKTGALPMGRTQPSAWPAMGGGSSRPYAWLGPEEASLCPAGWRQGGPPLTGSWRWRRSGAPALGSGGSSRGHRPPALTCGCWSCGLPASWACPQCLPHPRAGLCPSEATA